MPRESSADPNVTLETIRLLKCDFNVNPDFPIDRRTLEIAFNFDLKRNFPESTILVALARVGLFEHAEAKPFTLVVEYEARFTVPSADHADALRKFGRYDAPATLIPYLREAIANVTGRTNFGPLLLPP